MENIIGKRFGRLTAIEYSGKRSLNRISIWRCKCDCGRYCFARSDRLKSGSVKSCGCFKKECEEIWHSKVKSKHVENTALYQISDSRKLNKNNTSGIKGVTWDKRRNKWHARIAFKGKTIFLGYFLNKEDAINARLIAEEKYYKPILNKYSDLLN